MKTGRKGSEGLLMKFRDTIDVQSRLARGLMDLRAHLINI